MISIARSRAAPLRMTPSKKKREAACIVRFLPNMVHDLEAKKLETSAAR